MLKHRGFPGRLSGTDFQFVIRRANPKGVTPITRRERSMLTLALLAAMGNFDEIPMHIRATARTGASPEDIREVFQHVAIYAGVPRANHALKLAQQTLVEMAKEARASGN